MPEGKEPGEERDRADSDTPESQRPARRRERASRREAEREDTGDDPSRHLSIIARRWLGSERPTAEQYARAFRQWHALPGAVVLPATQVTGIGRPPAPGQQPDTADSAGSEHEQ
jgi:hypothetical protein